MAYPAATAAAALAAVLLMAGLTDFLRTPPPAIAESVSEAGGVGAGRGELLFVGRSGSEAGAEAEAEAEEASKLYCRLRGGEGLGLALGFNRGLRPCRTVGRADAGGGVVA